MFLNTFRCQMQMKVFEAAKCEVATTHMSTFELFQDLDFIQHQTLFSISISCSQWVEGRGRMLQKRANYVFSQFGNSLKREAKLGLYGIWSNRINTVNFWNLLCNKHGHFSDRKYTLVGKFSKRNLDSFGMLKKVQTLVFDDPAHSTKHWLNSASSCTWAVMLLTLFLLLDESKYQPLGVILSNKAPMMEGVRHFLYFWREYKKKTGRRWKYGLEYKKVRSGLLALTSPPASISLRLYYRACLPYIKHVIRCFKILYTCAGILWPILYSFSKVKAWMWIQNVGNKLKIIPTNLRVFSVF